MRPFLLFVLLILAVAPAAAETKLRVVSTFSILDDFVSEIGGDKVERSVIVGPDADVHTYQPKPTDARALAAAQVLVSNGLGFEGWIDRLAGAASFKGTRIIASAGVAAALDPHCWQDVACARRYVTTIADAPGTTTSGWPSSMPGSAARSPRCPRQDGGQSPGIIPSSISRAPMASPSRPRAATTPTASPR